MIVTQKMKTTTIFEAVNDDDVINKGYLDEKNLKIRGHLSLFKKIKRNINYNTTNNL